MLKKCLFGLAMLASFSSTAALTTIQTETYAGTAGNVSDGSVIQPFIFEKFDSALGTLTDVIFSYTFSINNDNDTETGYITVDNKTNAEQTGEATLGASLTFSSTDIDGFAQYTLFYADGTPKSLSDVFDFTVAADPTLSTGGNGPDRVTFFGTPDSKTFTPNTSGILNEFIGNSSDTLTFNFVTTSVGAVSVGGAEVSTTAVDMALAMNIQYEYTPFAEPTDTPIPAPGAFALCLLAVSVFAGRSYVQKQAANK
ncbi:MAG: choice-of-anchor E domain-containing protein [Alteromonadaceae bacterium]|nr:choice-of-anchor E domain-containing protein [Alteromonadaceae bacterium]